MIAAFCDALAIHWEKDLLLREHTTFRIGGPADYAVSPENTLQMAEVLRFLNENKIRYFVLGRGSDILASDEGYRGVLVMTRSMKQLYREGDRIVAGAGCSMASVANLAQKEGLAGLEFLHGIPGSIGGGVFMNAGAYGSEMAMFIESVEWVDLKGQIHRFTRDQMEFSYRHSYFTNNPGVVCSAVFRCNAGDPAAIRETTMELDRRRREKQPLEYPSAGSAFKRPEGYFAGKLIEDAGLKGYSIGGAWVSEKHAGFIVNKGGATEKEVKQLINHVADTVYQQFGVRLEPEIRFLDE